MDSFSGLNHRAIGSVVQDVDRDDNGLNELLVLTQGGIIYCFDTPGLSQERQGLPRARSEVYFYSESRLGASEYVPYESHGQMSSPPTQLLSAVNVSTLTQLSFRLNHPLSQTMSYTVTSTPNIGSGSGTVWQRCSDYSSERFDSVHNVSLAGQRQRYFGSRNKQELLVHNLSSLWKHCPQSRYTHIEFNQQWKRRIEDLICYNQTTTDLEGNNVTNIYNWLKSGTSIANLILPFDTKPDPNAVYSGTAVTRDYSRLGKQWSVFGATWTKGIVGGAFSFDGDDFIRVEEQSNSLDGGGSWSAMSVEFWIKATTTGSNWKLIWKPDRYDTFTALLTKSIFNTRDNQLSFTWGVNTNAAGYNTVSYQTTAAVTDWHHVVCTYKSGVGLTIYFDGVQAAANLNPDNYWERC